MPQKKNPDVAELVRGKAGRLIGDLAGLLSTFKGLPLAYNRDLQEDKEPVFDAADTLAGILSALDGLIGTMRFRTDRMAEAAGDWTLRATAIAEELVKRGVAFRDAHEAVGRLVSSVGAAGPAAMTREQLMELNPHLPDAVLAVLDEGVPSGTVGLRAVPKTNEEIEELFFEWSDLILISGGDPFRARSYERPRARSARYPKDVGTLDEKGLLAIPAIGKNMATRIREYAERGSMHELEELREMVPPGVRELTKIPGLGPKKAVLLNQELGVATIDELQKAIAEHRLAGIKGFGAKTEENLRQGIEQLQQPATAPSSTWRWRSPRSSWPGSRECKAIADVGLRRVAAADARDDRRHRHPGRQPTSRPDHGRVRRLAAGRHGRSRAATRR